MGRRSIDLTLAILASALGFALSWPFWRDFEYWAESRAMWWIYFVVGFVLAVYVFMVCIGCVRMLFLHDSIMRQRAAKTNSAPNTTNSK
ncbi:MAG: hypothetical protein IT448_11475 [Phycisphaerales bacterium]|nr:hypothetical protein [Phycisphaerales bacterium]